MARDGKQPREFCPACLTDRWALKPLYLNQQSGHLPACEAWVAAVSTTALKITEAATSHLRIEFNPCRRQDYMAGVKFKPEHYLLLDIPLIFLQLWKYANCFTKEEGRAANE